MEDSRPLDGMARSIDALFTDAEKRQDRELPAHAQDAQDGDGAVEGASASVAEDSVGAPGSLPENVGVLVGEADLLDEVDMILPRTDPLPGPSPVVPIDAEDEEDPAELAAAASWSEVEGAQPAPTAELPEAASPVAEAPAAADLTAAEQPAAAESPTGAEPPARPEPSGAVELAAEPSAAAEPAARPPVAEHPASVEAPVPAQRPDAVEQAPPSAAAPPARSEPLDPVEPPAAVEPPAPAEPAATEAPSAPAEPPAAPTPPDEVALRAREMAVAVSAFLEAEPRRREAAADVVREAAAAHREAREVDAPADAVERLAVAGGQSASELARELALPPVAARLVDRLGMTREDERRRELLSVASTLGASMASPIADALSGAEDRAARRNYVEALVHLGETGFREAEAMLGDPRWFVVRNGVAILGEIGGERAVEHLTSALGHADARVRREVLMALARVGGDNAAILVSGKLEDPVPAVRAAAAMAVGALRVERAQRPLQALLDREDDEDAVVEVLRALGQLGDPGAVPAIEKKAVGGIFSRPAAAVRVAAYRALGAIGTPHAKQLIERAAEDREPEVRHVARHLLQG